MLTLAAITIHPLSIFIALVLAALAWWVVGQFEVPAPIAKLVRVLIVVVFVLWLLADMFGFTATTIRIGS